MTNVISRCVIVAATASTLALGGLPAADGVAPHATKPRIGHRCLIGTWRDGKGVSSTLWNGHKVKMRYGGGDVDHIHASGRDTDNWTHSKPFIGKVKGHKLKEVIRGHNVLHFKSIGRHKLRTTEKGWSKGSTNRYVYRGKHVHGYLNQHGHHTQYFRCTAKTLTWKTKKGKVVGKEFRISRKP
jgi:hypothetical protein